MHSSTHQEKIFEKINLISIYTTEEGRNRVLNFDRKHLALGKSLNIKGYVTGVVIFCNDEVEAGLDGMPMSPIRENRNGTLACRYFGPLQSTGKLLPFLRTVSPGNVATTSDHEVQSPPKYLFGGYSYFPKVLGDGVSHRDHFLITLKKGDDFLQIPVQQQSSKSIFEFPMEDREKITFYYQGNAERLAGIKDLQQRLTLISEGIRSVENRFNINLTSRVNIIDYGNICNAVTCEGGKEIWFYYNTLKDEPMSEIKVIAEHETLHLLVNLLGCAKNNDLLAHFADLKGYDIFSRERFLLITQGFVLPDNAALKQNDAFFAFIDERNFLKGMKGGHSHQNPDEFCASFIHSLMYSDQLQENLNRPLFLHDCQQPRYLTREERESISTEYSMTLEILKKSIAFSKKLNLNGILKKAQVKTMQEKQKS